MHTTTTSKSLLKNVITFVYGHVVNLNYLLLIQFKYTSCRHDQSFIAVRLNMFPAQEEIWLISNGLADIFDMDWAGCDIVE